MTGSIRSTQRIVAAAEAAGLSIRVQDMPESTRTAEDAARACGCEVAQIVKSLVFTGAESGRPYLLLVSGENRVNEADIAELVGEGLSRPDGRTVRKLTGYAIGGIPPIGHEAGIVTLMDSRLLDFERVWAAAGTPNSVFEVEPEALSVAAGARLHPFAGS